VADIFTKFAKVTDEAAVPLYSANFIKLVHWGSIDTTV